MSAALPSQPALPPRGHPLPIEALRARLGGLLSERELLRRNGAERADLERNRREICRVQWELSHAFVLSYAA